MKVGTETQLAQHTYFIQAECGSDQYFLAAKLGREFEEINQLRESLI
jgi:hypothetical protein